MWFLKFIPGLGKIIGGAFDYLNKKQDVDLEKYKVDGKLNETLVAAEIAITKSRVDAMSNLNWIHYSFGVATLIYYIAILYDALTEKLFPGVHWDVMPLKGLAGYWAGMIMTFFFLPSITSVFKR